MLTSRVVAWLLAASLTGLSLTACAGLPKEPAPEAVRVPYAPRVCDDPPAAEYRVGEPMQRTALTAAGERDAALLRLAGCRTSWNAMAEHYRGPR